MTFTISSHHNVIANIARAESVEDAAARFARRVYGRNATAVRTTGDTGLSGYFQAYKPVPARLGGGRNSTGSAFHVA